MRPSDEKATDITVSLWPEKVCFALPVFASHSFTVLSKLPLARVWPSREKVTEVISAPCPLKVCFSAPVAASHNLIGFLNPSTRANVCPLAAKAPGGPVSSKLRFNDPVCASQSCTALPSPPLASVFPSPEKATDLTLSSCPVRVCFSEPLKTCSGPDSLFAQLTAVHIKGRMKTISLLRLTVFSDDAVNMRTSLGTPQWRSQSTRPVAPANGTNQRMMKKYPSRSMKSPVRHPVSSSGVHDIDLLVPRHSIFTLKSAPTLRRSHRSIRVAYGIVHNTNSNTAATITKY